MTIKPEGEILKIREQIIDDPVSGLQFQFICSRAKDAPFRMRIFGDLQNGNREILFDADGREAGAGTAFYNSCIPTWLEIVKGK